MVWLNFLLGPGQHLLIYVVSITGVYRDAVLDGVSRACSRLCCKGYREDAKLMADEDFRSASPVSQ